MTLRILDPACGSGSFLLGAYQYLLTWYRDRYVEDGPAKWAKGKEPRIYQGAGGEWKLTTGERKRILLSHIYGVDIDSQAVEVTKLSLLLKVLEGETQESIVSQLKLFHERALPDLANNIKCGNSLIGSDFYKGKQPDLFNEEEATRVNAFDWDIEFPEVFSPQRRGDTEKTDSNREEGRTGGFDVVIGNPPYGGYLYDQDKSYLKCVYSTQSYQLDSYLLFLERALRVLLRHGGYYGMIIPNPWLTNLLQVAIRKFVMENTCVHSIVHFQFPVFPRVVVDTEVVVLQKLARADWRAEVVIADTLQDFMMSPWDNSIRKITHLQQKWRDGNGAVINIFLSECEERLAVKCKMAGVPLGSLCDINVGIKPYQVGKGIPPQTRTTVDERPFDSDHQINASYRQCLRGTDIGRFCIAPTKQRFLLYGPWLAEPRPAADFNAPVKIVMRQTGDSLVAALDTNQLLCMNNMHVLIPRGNELTPMYLLGVVNSKLLNWYYHTLNPEMGEALAEVKKTNVSILPIHKVTFADATSHSRYDKMVLLVDQMLSLHKRLQAARTEQDKTLLQRQIAATDKEIDRLVYNLYALTDEEIVIVEGSDG